MQARNPPAATDRTQLLARLDRETRQASGLGVMFSQAVAGKLGIGASDLELIDVLLLRGRMTAGEVAAATGLTSGAVTGMIDRLERGGYVRRERDPVDRRRVYVVIEPGAEKRAGPYYASLSRAAGRILESYSDKEIALFADYFARARDMMAAEIEKLREKPAETAKPAKRTPRSASRPKVRSPRR